jgi:Ca2+-binding RTX toxin-like protein
MAGLAEHAAKPRLRVMRPVAALLLVVTALAGLPSGGTAAGAPACQGLPATIVGTPDKDIIRGTPGDDVIAALAGDDMVKGLAGDDVVCGGPGHDHLVSRNGRDILVGGPQRDRIEAHSPRPVVVRGGAGADRLELDVTDEPGYVIDGGAGRDVGELALHFTAEFGGPPLVIRRGPGDLLREGARTGAFRSVERLVLDERLAYEYYGTRERDVVSVSDGAWPFRAFTYGGADWIRSYEGDDYIDSGRGDDRVNAGPGTDICVGAESRRGCETVSP